MRDVRRTNPTTPALRKTNALNLFLGERGKRGSANHPESHPSPSNPTRPRQPTPVHPNHGLDAWVAEGGCERNWVWILGLGSPWVDCARYPSQWFALDGTREDEPPKGERQHPLVGSLLARPGRGWGPPVKQGWL